MRAFISALALVFFSTPALAEGFDELQRDEVRSLVREYILDHPEIIEEAFYALEERRRLARAAETRENIAAASEELLSHPLDAAIGSPDAPVQIVEFFDYNCGYCRRSAPWVRELLETHGDQVRVIFKETPIFGSEVESSDYAGRAALAAHQQGQFLDFHMALMEQSGTLSVDRVNEIARDAGIDMGWLANALEDPQYAEHLEYNLDLGHRIGLTGTPLFIVNGEPVPGANFPELDRLIAEALETAQAG